MIGIEYPRCSEVETWNHIIKYNETRYLRVQYVKELTTEILKEKLPNIEEEEIFSLVEDMLRYFKNNKSKDYEINQVIIGMNDLFRGYVVKIQMGINFNSKKYTKLNKIAMKYYIKYYNNCQKYKNEYYYDTEKQRERIVKWYENAKRYIENVEPL